MPTAHTILKNRLYEVVEEVKKVLTKEVQEGRITSDLAIEKVEHLINVALKLAATSPDSHQATDAAPSPADSFNNIEVHAPAISIPEVLTVETAKPMGFVRLSFGLVNLVQVAMLDVKAKQLFLQGGIIRSLEKEDLQKLIFWIKHYPIK